MFLLYRFLAGLVVCVCSNVMASAAIATDHVAVSGLSIPANPHLRFLRFQLLSPMNCFSLRIWDEDDGIKFATTASKELTIQTNIFARKRQLDAEGLIEFNNLTLDSSGAFIANTGVRSPSAVQSIIVEPLAGAGFMAISGSVDFGCEGLDFFQGYDVKTGMNAPTSLRFVNVGSLGICLDTRRVKSFHSMS